MSNNETKNVSGQNKEKAFSVRAMAITAMLSALAFVLMYLEIPIPLMPSYIKFDFSDLPAVIGAFALGPVYGVVIELIKNVIHLVVSQSMFIGEMSNFILGAVFVCCAGLIYKFNRTKKGAIIAGIAGAVAMGLVSIISNYFIVYPVYVNVFFGGDENICVATYDVISYDLLHIGHVKSLIQCLVCFNLPFTVLKGLISVVITMLVYKPLRKIIHK